MAITDITSSHSGSEVAAIINGNSTELGVEATEITGQMHGQQVAGALNTAFGDVDDATELTSSLAGAAFADAVNGNFELMEEQPTIPPMKFLHMSDCHNQSGSIVKCKELMDDDETILATILTGDFSAQGGGYGNVDAALAVLGSKLLMQIGNHDIYNTFNSNQANATAYLKRRVVDANVHWGDTYNVASYFYRDYPISNGGKVRVICADSYDYSGGVGTGAKYDTVYSQAQVDWFIGRLLELNDGDYLIVTTHEPVVNSPTGIVGLRAVNKFCSNCLWTWDNNLTNSELFPKIIDAYMKREVLDTTVNNTESSTGDPVLSVLDLEADFTEAEGTFLFYLGGHLHGECCTYHPNYPSQLMMLVDTAQNTPNGQSSDIRTRDNAILINKLTLDFANKTTTVDRIGLNEYESYNGKAGGTRDTITFPFKKTQ